MSTPDLVLSGTLGLSGVLKLAAAGGTVKVDGADVLVVDPSLQTAHGSATPVMQPPPPAMPSPLDNGTQVRITTSFNRSVSVVVRGADRAVVALGMTAQGNNAPPPWPGMVLPSVVNTGVKIDGSAINVTGDQGVTLPSGGTINFNASGQ